MVDGHLPSLVAKEKSCNSETTRSLKPLAAARVSFGKDLKRDGLSIAYPIGPLKAEA
jgi:hypothetical protein